MSDLDLARETRWQPIGPRRGADTRLLVQGVLSQYDDARREATVIVGGGNGTILPVLADVDWTRMVGLPVWVLRDPIEGRCVLALCPTARVPSSSTAALTYPPDTGTVTAVAANGITVQTTDGTFVCSSVVTTAAYAINDVVVLMWARPDAPWVIGKRGATAGAAVVPAVPAAPTLSRSSSVVTVTWVKSSGSTTTDVQWKYSDVSTWTSLPGLSGTSTTFAMQQGRTVDVQVRGVSAAGASAYSSTSSLTWAVTAPPPAQLVTRTKTIVPTWSGTWRAMRSDWDRWNVDRYGGRSTCYQGNAYGSGDLTGLAVYGSQVTALKAVDITACTVTLRGAGVASATIRVQGSTNGSKPSGAPSVTGGTVSASVTESGVTKLALSSTMRDALRTGVIKGLATNGTAYGAVRGTSAADGMALTITYTTYA